METFPSLLPAARRTAEPLPEEKATQSTDSVWNLRAPSGFILFALLRENSRTELSHDPTAAECGVPLPTLCRHAESQITSKDG